MKTEEGRRWITGKEFSNNAKDLAATSVPAFDLEDLQFFNKLLLSSSFGLASVGTHFIVYEFWKEQRKEGKRMRIGLEEGRKKETLM